MASKFFSRKLGALVAALCLLWVLGAANAQATFETSPFYEQTEVVLQAHAIEMFSARLRGVAALAASEPESIDEEDGEDNLGEVIEALEVDLRRFAATLEAQDSDLAASLDRAVASLESATEQDGDVSAAADEAAALADRARQAVLGARLEMDPALAAAVMAILLTTENGGIGEGYEEAVEGEVGPYAVGWAALARIAQLWSQLEPMANETQQFEVNDMLSELQVLFPGPRPGPEVERSDPEEAEGSTQRLAGFLEEVTNADLFPSRDLGRLLTRVRELSAGACDAYAAGESVEGLEAISNAAFVYGEYLGNTLALFSPEAANEAQELFDVLSPGAMGEEEGEEDDVDGEEAEEEDEEEEEEADPMTGDAAAAACAELVLHLETAGSPFGI